MTEKNYIDNKSKVTISKAALTSAISQTKKSQNQEDFSLTTKDIQNYQRAGQVAQQVTKYAKTIIKPGMKLLDIAEKIEKKIIELGAKPAFPCNLSINDIAAHYTPSYNDETLASGLLKIDIGVHVHGAIADTAFSLDLENSEENKKLIEASEKALEEALKITKKSTELRNIGKVIHNSITSQGFSPIRNLSGHELSSYRIHAGITIPNYDNNNPHELEQGAYAIEPFATTGQGEVYDSSPSGIYKFEERKGVRDSLSREIMDFIQEEYQTLPFCQRWIIAKFGTRALISLSLMEKTGIISQYAHLVEKSHEPVSQAEHTIIILKDKAEVTTR